MNLTIFSDGGARGNPGPAGYGFVIYANQKKIYSQGDFLGVKTNNEAEYAGVIAALEYLNANPNFSKATFILDSQLLSRQLNGQYKIKAPHLRTLKLQVDTLLASLTQVVEFTETLRHNNQEADLIANQAMDRKTKIINE